MHPIPVYDKITYSASFFSLKIPRCENSNRHILVHKLGGAFRVLKPSRSLIESQKVANICNSE